MMIQQRLSTAIGRKLLVLLMVCASVCSLSAQQQEPTVRFPNSVSTIQEAFNQIESQTGYKLSINHTNFDVTREVNLPTTAVGLEEALRNILDRSDRTYMLRGRHILIIPQAGAPAITPTLVQPDPEPIPVIVPEVEPEPRPVHSLLIKPGDDISVKQRPWGNRTSGVRFNSHRETARRMNDFINPVRQLPELMIKTNLLYGAAALTPNLGVEIGVSPRSTVDIRGSYNPWNLDGTSDNNKKLAHWIISAEYRHWFCERFSGHFVGLHGFGGGYNISQHKIPLLFGESDSDLYRYKGSIVGVGVSYGYQWVLGRRWNLEAQIGVGVGLMKYDRFDCVRCGDPSEWDVSRTYFGPTRLGITLMYMIK